MGLFNLFSQLRRAASRRSQPQTTPAGLADSATALARGARLAGRQPRLANWLEDSLRLRPARVLRRDVRAASTPLPIALPTRREEVIAGTSHAVADTAENERPARATESVTGGIPGGVHVDAVPTLRASSTAPRVTTPRMVASNEDAESQGGEEEERLDSLEGMDAVQRRLVLIRYLVRQRVYNEGFAPDATPDQYRWPTPPQIPPLAE